MPPARGTGDIVRKVKTEIATRQPPVKRRLLLAAMDETAEAWSLLEVGQWRTAMRHLTRASCLLSAMRERDPELKDYGLEDES